MALTFHIGVVDGAANDNDDGSGMLAKGFMYRCQASVWQIRYMPNSSMVDTECFSQGFEWVDVACRRDGRSEENEVGR